MALAPPSAVPEPTIHSGHIGDPAGDATSPALSSGTASTPSVPAPASSFRRYHIDTSRAPDLAELPSRFLVQVNRLNLAKLLVREAWEYRGQTDVIFNRPCVYGVFGGPVGGFAPRPRLCVGCLRCTVQHPDVVRILRNPAWQGWGDDYFKPPMVETVMNEALTGAVPVRGQGFRGRFGGPGWDGIWTDMSEIVRPTRDGIHGRETISTVVDIGTKPMHLHFGPEGTPSGEAPNTFQLQLPILFDVPPASAATPTLARVLAAAAGALETLAILPIGLMRQESLSGRQLVPLVGPDDVGRLAELTVPPRMVEVTTSDILTEVEHAMPKAQVCVRIELTAGWRDRFEQAVDAGSRIIHLVADYHGRGEPLPDDPTPAIDAEHVRHLLHEAHRRLVERGVRDRVTLIASGGMVMAEHVPKAIICGADAVAVDTAVMAALQAKPAGPGLHRDQAIYHLPESLSVGWGVQRLKNMSAAWRDQLLEVLGAMGMREVRRLRGETGRAMFQIDLEREAFGGISGYPG